MNFNSLDELYKRLLPALDIKAKESNGLYSAEDIWNYLAKEKWAKSNGLSLAEMVDDILKFDFLCFREDDLL